MTFDVWLLNKLVRWLLPVYAAWQYVKWARGQGPKPFYWRQKVSEFRALWDMKSRIWRCSNDTLPMTVEASTLDGIFSQIKEMAPEIARMNGLAAANSEIRVHIMVVNHWHK